MGISERFDQYMEDLADGLAHADRRAGLKGYCTGLMLPLSRKSVEPMAARLDPQHVSARHQSLHHFVAKSQWSDEAVLSRVREQVSGLLGTEGGLYWIIDDTGFPKKGKHSVGVSRQYCGQLGRQDNCQVAVRLSLASPRGSVPISGRMKAYSLERKEALVRRMMAPENALVSALARETGITEQTLYTWRRQIKGPGVAVPGDKKRAQKWSSQDKFAVVLETAALNTAELAEYCRGKGVYPEQIAAWRSACQSANANAGEQSRDQRHQSKEDKQRIRQLEKELQRKEKALAEAAALLILRKKAQAIRGDKEDD